jgi:hypothetical protein
MRLLVDTNLFIEVLLNQVNAGEARTKPQGSRTLLLSFDADFDRTTEGRLLPADVL